MSCGHVKTENGERFVVVAGGRNDTGYVADVEMISLDNPTKWVNGPAFPINEIVLAKAYQFDDKFMVSGGYNAGGYYYNTIFEFGSDLDWIPLKSFENARWSHAIFDIPDEWAECYVK